MARGLPPGAPDKILGDYRIGSEVGGVKVYAPLPINERGMPTGSALKADLGVEVDPVAERQCPDRPVGLPGGAPFRLDGDRDADGEGEGNGGQRRSSPRRKTRTLAEDSGPTTGAAGHEEVGLPTPWPTRSVKGR